MSASSAAEDAIALVTMLGWEPATARASVEHICGALAKAGARHTAFETLRRDQHARALLDLPGRSWTGLLKALLGNPHPALAATSASRGVLLRLLIGRERIVQVVGPAGFAARLRHRLRAYTWNLVDRIAPVLAFEVTEVTDGPLWPRRRFRLGIASHVMGPEVPGLLARSKAWAPMPPPRWALPLRLSARWPPSSAA